MARIGHLKVSKRDWYLNGGFANWRCWRRMRHGAWQYFMDCS